MIRPDWDGADDVVALVTTRAGGISRSPFDTFNLALHVGDDPACVARNREILYSALPDRVPVHWLTQVHGTQVYRADGGEGTFNAPEADAIFLAEEAVAGVIMTADCLPVFFADTSGRAVAAAHAGWRGLAEGVLENTIAHFDNPEAVIAWLGPAIGPCHFEVGADVREIFLSRAGASAENLQDAFRPADRPGKWMADIYAIARLRLREAGITRISGGQFCTVCDSRFYSYRRDGVTGRMASLIYRRPAAE